MLGVTQSVASLSRTVGPLIASDLIYSAMPTLGYDQKMHEMSDHTLRVTFWAAAAIMFVAFMVSIYFARRYAAKHEMSSPVSEPVKG